MSTQNVYEVITVPLQDGSEVELKPASIKLLKKGQAELDRLASAESSDETLDILLDVVTLLLAKQRPDLVGPVGSEARDLAEDLFDLETIYKVVEVYLGVKLNDPNLVEAAIRQMQKDEQN
jgi:hypothetical protein